MPRWTQSELECVFRLRAGGVSNPQIAEELGRSLKAIKSVLYNAPRKSKPTGYYQSPAFTAPPIEQCPEQLRLIRNAIAGSARLRAAILAMAA